MKGLARKWSFGKKMKVLFSASIILISLLVLFVMTFFSVKSAFVSARASAEKNLEVLCENYESILEQIKNTCVAILMDDSVQAWLENEDAGSLAALDETEKARGILLQAYNSNNRINFIMLYNEAADKYIYRGASIAYKNQEEVWRTDYEKSVQNERNAVRTSFGSDYFGGKIYTFSMYFPAFSNQSLGISYGMLSINLKNDVFSGIFNQNRESKTGEFFMADMDGRIVASRAEERIGKEAEYVQNLSGESGSFVKGGTLINYRKLGNWNYYLLSVTPVSGLYFPGIQAAAVTALLVLGIIVVCTTAAGRLLAKVYAPLGQVVREMGSVSNEHLDVRINAEPLGKDFEQMAESFNGMMDRLCEAMEEVRVKQEQLSQTRLNALQSQIQPHFLYNTLDCIHWQAVAEGNHEISTLVKALASYYRICLSKGKDVIPLSEELSHIRYYAIIQNMRYDNRLRLEIRVDAMYLNLRLPKLTLQPLVENSIEHGINRKEGRRGEIRIWVEEEEGDILLKVADSGAGMTVRRAMEMNEYLKEDEAEFGYGVRNVNRRIELLFGESYGLHYEMNEKGGVTVTVRLPGRQEGEKDV